MDARFHLNQWRTTGVQPRGAQVRRVTGSSETPDSSQKTMTALRRRAFLPDPRPVALHPPLDGLLVALDGPAGGALQPPAQPAAQQLPHMTGVVGDPGDLLDHRGDARKGPVVGVEAMRPGALSERMADRLKLSLGQARSVPGRASAVQRLRPTRAPAPMPAADVLPRDTESAGDLGLGAAGGEQLAGLQTDTFEGLAVTQTTGVAAVSGWSHPAMLPGEARSCHRNTRTSLGTAPSSPAGCRHAGRHGGEPLITHTEEVPANLCSSTTPDHAVNRNPKLLLRGRIGRRVRFGCLLDHLNATVSPWDGAVGFV